MVGSLLVDADSCGKNRPLSASRLQDHQPVASDGIRHMPHTQPDIDVAGIAATTDRQVRRR